MITSSDVDDDLILNGVDSTLRVEHIIKPLSDGVNANVKFIIHDVVNKTLLELIDCDVVIDDFKKSLTENESISGSTILTSLTNYFNALVNYNKLVNYGRWGAMADGGFTANVEISIVDKMFYHYIGYDDVTIIPINLKLSHTTNTSQFVRNRIISIDNVLLNKLLTSVPSFEKKIIDKFKNLP